VVEFLSDNIGAVAGCALFVAVFPLLGACLSCCLASTVNKAKYEQMS
jgi:tetraspanin-7